MRATTTPDDDDAQGEDAVRSAGERGKQGDHGQDGIDGTPGLMGQAGHDGRDGETGLTGLTGERGRPGRSLTVWQAMALFFLILVIGLVMTYRTERQASRIETQQREIAANAQMIRDAQYQSCLGGVVILSRFNDQQDALAEIERSQLTNPDLAKRRIAAYQAARVLPLPVCKK